VKEVRVGAKGPSWDPGNSESEVAHGERGAHPRQDKIGSVRRVWKFS
jgi:hypothetical protein